MTQSHLQYMSGEVQVIELDVASHFMSVLGTVVEQLNQAASAIEDLG